MPWYRRWRNVFRPESLDGDLRRELEYHLAETVDRLTAGGMAEEEAWRQARRQLGNYAVHKERIRDMNVAAWLDAARADLVYGLRQLQSSPGFAAIAVLSLALGIGANTAIFQLVDAIRLKTLPVEKPWELVSIDFEPGATRSGWWPTREAAMTYPEWEQIRAQQQAFSGVFAWSADQFNLATGGEPRLAEGLYVSGDLFRQLGINAVLGRTFTAEDDGPACHAGAVISYSFWQREFGGGAGVLERTVNLNGRAFPVIGVTPPSFFGLQVGNRYDVAIPLCADRLLAAGNARRIGQTSAWWLLAMGRLKPGWTVQRASAHLHALSPAVMRATLPSGYRPDMAKSYLANRLTASAGGTGLSGLRRQYEQLLWLMLAATGMVLLIACANLANLLLARAAAREPETAIRLAMGASRGRLIRQFLLESLLLAFAGAVLGAGLAAVASRTLVAFISSAHNPVFVDLGLDWRMLGFTAALGVLTCVLVGLLPAFRATRLAPAAAMKTGGRSVSTGRAGLRRTLVAGQVAISLVLLFGALLFVRSLHNLLTADTGFEAQGLLAVTIDFSHAQYPTEKRLAVYRELSDRLSGVSGVVSVAQVSFPPLTGTWDNLVAPDGALAAKSGRQSFFSSASPGYFRTMETPLLAGREFDDHDTLGSPKVAIVNQAFARKFFGGANPLEHTFHRAADAGEAEPSFQIVGLVKNTKYADLREDFKPIAYFPIAQDENPGSTARFVMRTAGQPGTVIHRAKDAVEAMAPSMGIEFRSMTAQIGESLLREKLMATLSGCFGFLAALLAMLGLYGVIAYMVAARRQEIGVRIALGAAHADVIRLVLRETVLLLGVGLAAGVALALAAGQSAATLLFGLPPNDAGTLAAAGALLALVALIASYVPARRAAAVDPNTALRSE